MENRFITLIILLGIGVGLVFGVLGTFSMDRSKTTTTVDAIQLAAPEQDDFVIMVAESYASDSDLNLAQDRLTRLHETRIQARVEKLANDYAPQHDLIAAHLARLAVAMGSHNTTLL